MASSTPPCCIGLAMATPEQRAELEGAERAGGEIDAREHASRPRAQRSGHRTLVAEQADQELARVARGIWGDVVELAGAAVHRDLEQRGPGRRELAGVADHRRCRGPAAAPV